MISQTLLWWLVSSLLGLFAFPIAWRVFSRLPDRGWGLSRALGLAVSGYVLWLGASVGGLQNDRAGALAGIVILFCVGLVVARGRWREIVAWLRERGWSLLVMEGLFLVAFGVWAFVRANDPNIEATEKPMELAFLNAILRSPRFPPNDPWLSGHAISYYYFGYVLLAFMTRVTGVASGVAFNLGNALWFAMTVLGAYSLLYNLLAKRRGGQPIAAALLGPLYVVVVGNLEGALEVLHAGRVFWREGPDGFPTSELWRGLDFWKWINLKDLVRAPSGEVRWMPTRYLWWWRASRVVRDVNFAGADFEVIDEFPFFSFLLADNHPHLLAFPFVLIAIAFALQIFLQGKGEGTRLAQGRLAGMKLGPVVTWCAALLFLLIGVRASTAWLSGLSTIEILMTAAKAMILGALGIGLLGTLILLQGGKFVSALGAGEFWFAAWLFGGLAFLNTWDLPIYLSLLLAVMWWVGRHQPWPKLAARVGLTAVGLVVAGVLLYLPWYPTFSSQASGILPNFAFPTRMTQFLIMFGPSFVPILAWLLWRGWRGTNKALIAALTIGLPLALLLISSLLTGVGYVHLSRSPGALEGIVRGLGAEDVGALVDGAVERRLRYSWTALSLGAVVAFAISLLVRRSSRKAAVEAQADSSEVRSFVTLLVIIGALLVIGPEFLYLRDFFSTRMNTIFKFYFAGWVFWGLAASFAVVDLRPRKRVLGVVMNVVVILPLVLGLVYPALSVRTKTSSLDRPQGQTLDGTAYLASANPYDNEAIDWINENLEGGVIAEAVGGSYSGAARISTHTGIPTVLGWEFHEIQWRGSGEAQGTRKDDIRRLYEAQTGTELLEVIERYDISYVYLGAMERSSYENLSEVTLEAFLRPIYRNAGVTIYAAPGARVPE